MGGTDSPELDAARTALDKAVREFVRVKARENGIADDAYTIAWAGYAEYTSPELQANDESGNAILVPDDQNAATSRGCLEFGADIFSRGR